MKKLISLFVALCLSLLLTLSLAEGGNPPAMPDGEPPAMGDMDARPERPEGGMPGEPGDMPGGMGMPGGGSSQPESYDAALTVNEDMELTGEYTSTGTDENAILVASGDVTLTDATVTRESVDSSGGDNASFYGVGAALLVTGGTLTVSDAVIDTNANGGAGVFAYGDGVAYVSDCVITTAQGASGGIHVAGGGALYATNLTVTTQGQSSAAIRSDRGSGTMVVEGGSYTSNGVGSPAVYVTADITISDAALTANGSEALCLEGRNSVALYNCTLSGNMADDAQNDNTWTVILYQSMSGDSEIGEGTFIMDGGALISQNGGLFYTTNTDSAFTLRNVTIEASDDCEYFLRCTGNANQRGWGAIGSNGANCVFTAIEQTMNGDIVYDSVSNLDLYLTESSVLTGAVYDDESCAGEGGDGECRVVIDETSTWIVTADSAVSVLENAGSVVDTEGDSVTIIGTDGVVYVEGSGATTVTVSEYIG